MDRHPPTTYNAVKLGITAKALDSYALTVINQLQQAGFDAYIVGGSVRDLLVGLTPKDFDVATNATPEQVKQTIRNCRIIGKRFRLAHVFFKRYIIEVATFRGCHSQAISAQDAVVQDGRILRDNVYGSIEEDAKRRDFTINALYYDPIAEIILDFVGGMQDLKAKKLHLIGDPVTRYQEDPVRMLRAIRIANKLNFKIERKTKNGIAKCLNNLDSVSPARLFEEYIKIFLHGRGESNFQALHKHNCLAKLFPQAVELLGNKSHSKLIALALNNTDKRIASGKTINPAFLISVFLWQPLLTAKKNMLTTKQASYPYEAHQLAVTEVLQIQIQTLSIPRRFTATMRDIWQLQMPLEQRRPKAIYKILENPKFRAAYDFLLLRQGIGEVDKKLTAWWTKIQDVNADKRKQMVKEL